MNSLCFCDEKVVKYLINVLNDDILRKVVQFLPKHQCATIIEQCSAMSHKMLDIDTSIFEGIRRGMFDIDGQDPIMSWIQFNPSVISHFVGCKVLKPSIDFRSESVFGSKGRKGSNGRNSGKGRGRIVESVYADARIGVSQMSAYRITTSNVPNVYRI